MDIEFSFDGGERFHLVGDVSNDRIARQVADLILNAIVEDDAVITIAFPDETSIVYRKVQ